MTHHQVTYSQAELIALKKRGAEYIVVARANIGNHHAGQAVSWHKAHDAACRKVGDSGWYTVQDIGCSISYANF